MSSSTDKFFTRQTAVPNWNTPEKQQRIKNQVALLLGTGGIGCSVALVLARLGIKEIILTDMDTVEASNINRQLLFTENDVGTRKVDAAKKNLELQHAVRGRTQVTAIHCDLVEEWGSKILPLFSDANKANAPTVIFNACDWGESFDRFVAEFARSRNIPYCAAASYAQHADFELVKNENAPSASCLSCRLGCDALSTSLLHSMLQVSSSSNNKNENVHLCFLPQDKKPETGTIGSSVLPCSMAGQLVVNCWINRVVVAEEEEQKNNNSSDPETRGNVFGMCELGSGVPEIFSFPTEKDANCLFCGGGGEQSTTNNKPHRRRQEQHDEETFSLAFGGEPVVLADAPKNSISIQSPVESSEERKQRIHLYRQLAEKIMSEEKANGEHDVDAIVKKILPNLQGHFSVKDRSTFVPCTPTIPYLLEGDDATAKSYYNDPSKNVFANQLLLLHHNTKSFPLLRNPLIKSKTGHIHGIRSGLRSAIIPPPVSKFIHNFVKNSINNNNNNNDNNASSLEAIYNRFSFNGTLLRLKGCGCVTHDTVENTKRTPFPIRGLDHPELKRFMPDAPDRWEIRGCQFVDTAIRESIVTKQIAEILSSSSSSPFLMLGNYPACLWKYADSKSSKQEVEESSDPRYGSIDKFCGVFRTVGDKRAEMHLLNGLELLVRLMLRSRTDEENEKLNTELRNRLFAESRKRSTTTKNKDGVDETATTILPTWNRTKGEPLWCSDRNNNSTLFDDAASSKLASIPEFVAFENVFVQQNMNSSCTAMLSKINSPYVTLWKELMEEFKNLPSLSTSSSFFSHIYQRLGYEMGYFHGLLNGSGFSWGLFFDHNPCEPHNNAHPNNFVVVAGALLSSSGFSSDDAPKTSFIPRQYLAAVDFDMSYSRDEFISNFTGELDEDLFRSNLEWERREMESVLSGNDDVSSGIVKGVVEARWKELSSTSSSSEDEKALPQGFPTIKYVMRDLLVAAMKRGYAEGQNVAMKTSENNNKFEIPATPCNVNNEKIMNIIVKLSLILTDRMNC